MRVTYIGRMLHLRRPTVQPLHIIAQTQRKESYKVILDIQSASKHFFIIKPEGKNIREAKYCIGQITWHDRDGKGAGSPPMFVNTPVSSVSLPPKIYKGIICRQVYYCSTNPSILSPDRISTAPQRASSNATPTQLDYIIKTTITHWKFFWSQKFWLSEPMFIKYVLSKGGGCIGWCCILNDS